MSKKHAKKSQTTQKQNNPLEGRVGLVYARVSSKRQEVEGSGLESQVARCTAWLSKAGIPFEKSFEDSISGAGDFLNRPAMRAILDHIDANVHTSYVVVFDDMKRFARDTEFHFKLRAALKARDVLPVCLNYSFDDSPEGEFAETIFAAQGQLERLQNRRQVIQKQRARLESGYWAFGRRKGYTMENDPVHGKIAVPSVEALKVLTPALESFADGTLIRKIDVCRFLVEKGFWKKQKPEKYIDKISKILTDPFYAGDIEYLAWGVTRRPGKHVGIITPEVFEQNQRRLKNEGLTKRVRQDISDDFPLRGLISCAGCGKQLTAGWSKGRHKRYAYYKCQNHPCTLRGKSVRGEVLEKGFEAILMRSGLKQAVGKIVVRVFNEVWREEISAHNEREAALGRARAAGEAKIGEYAELARKAPSEALRAVYERQIEETVTAMQATEAASYDGVDMATPYATTLATATGFLRHPHKLWPQFTTAEKQRLFYFVFNEKLPFHVKEGYRTAEISTAARLFEEFAEANPQDVEM